MSRKKKNPRPTARKPPAPPPVHYIRNGEGIFSSITESFKEWNKKRKERKLEKQEFAELASIIAEDVKVMADKAALLELADRQEKRAKELRKIARELT